MPGLTSNITVRQFADAMLEGAGLLPEGKTYYLQRGEDGELLACAIGCAAYVLAPEEVHLLVNDDGMMPREDLRVPQHDLNQIYYNRFRQNIAWTNDQEGRDAALDNIKTLINEGLI